MLYEEFPAPAHLQPFVSHFWFVRGAPVAKYENILPGPLAHLVLNLSSSYRLLDPFAASAEAGYYNQPHLIRSFRRFSGFTPSEYLRVVREHGPEHVTFVPLDRVGDGQPVAR